MGDFVQDIDDIRSNLRTLWEYLNSQNELDRSFARERLRHGYNLVAAVVEGDVIFGPSRFVGYKGISHKSHHQLGKANSLDGKETNPVLSRLLGEQIKPGHRDWERIEELFLKLCEKVEVAPDNRVRKFWALDKLGSNLLAHHETYYEGALSFYVSTRYERSAGARKACIEAHGATCVVCNFNFEQVYGEHGKGFIHVHHLRPLHKACGGNQTDPTKDLVPVCPNCHYMLHRGAEDITPDALRKIMKPK